MPSIELCVLYWSGVVNGWGRSIRGLRTLGGRDQRQAALLCGPVGNESLQKWPGEEERQGRAGVLEVFPRAVAVVG